LIAGISIPFELHHPALIGWLTAVCLNAEMKNPEQFVLPFSAFFSSFSS